MTVPSEQSRIQYTTDGTSVSFPVPFRFLNAAHLQVARQHNDESSILDLGVDYSVSGVGNQAGGTITTTNALPAGDTISIERVVPITQETAYQRNDPFPERAHEQALDKLTMVCQMLGGILGLTPGSINRALLLGAADLDGLGAYRANKNRIRDVGNAVSMHDAVNKKILLDHISGLSSDGSGQAVVERLADTEDTENGLGMIGFDGGTLGDQLSKDGVPDRVMEPYFPRIIKYNAGPVSTRALGITAGMSSTELATARLQRYIKDEGLDVYIEPSESILRIDGQIFTAREGQIICAEGFHSRIQQMADAATLISVNHDNCIIRDIHMLPSPIKTSTFEGFAIYASNCNSPIVERVYISSGRAGGIGFSGVTGGRIAHTRHLKSAVMPSDDHTLMGCDIALYRSCSDCLIDDVRSESGIGITVNIQTAVLTNEKSNGNTISNVYSKDQSAYAIALYVSDKTKQEMLSTTIINPMIDGVTGSIRNNVTNSRSYGAGIYVQGAEHTTIIGGHIRKTNQLTDSETLAPGGIGVTNSRSFSVIGTKISDCSWYGVFASDPANQGVAEGYGLLRDVEISRSGKSGIRQVTLRKLVIEGGKSVQNAAHGLNALKTTDVGVDTEVRGWITSANGGSGIETGNTTLLDIRDSFVNANAAAGINSAATTFNIDGAVVQGSGTFGVRAATGNLAGEIKNLTSRGNATGLEVPSSSNIGIKTSTNQVSGNSTANYSGALNATGGWRTLGNSATPNLHSTHDFYATGGTTAITGFLGGQPGQEITIFVAHGVTVLGRASTHGDVLKAINIGGGTGWRLAK